MITAMLLALSLMTGCGSRTIKKASEYISAGMYDEAIAVLRLEIQENPTNAEAHYLLGEAFISKGDVDSGKEELSRAIGLKKGFTKKVAEMYLRVAQRHLTNKDYRMGLHCIDQAVAQDPSLGSASAAVLSEAGVTSAEESPSASHALLVRAAELEPALLEKPDFAFLCQVQTEPVIAERAKNAEHLLQKFPDHRQADRLLGILGDAKFEQGNLKEAKAYYERLSEAYPNSSIAAQAGARLELIKHPRVAARVSNADDEAVLYVNGKEAVRTAWGKGEGGRSAGHRPGNSGWVDITDHLRPGTNEVRLWVWNAAGCCDVSGTFEVTINNVSAIHRVFQRQDSQPGVKYDETVPLVLP
jgi:tetratricopeptide (TPR) repeat protein